VPGRLELFPGRCVCSIPLAGLRCMICAAVDQWDYIMCHSLLRAQDLTTYHCVFRSIGVSSPCTIICTYRTNSKTTSTSAYVAGERAGVWRQMEGSRPRGPVVLLQLLLTKSRRRTSGTHSAPAVNCMCQDSRCKTQTSYQMIYA
jgi:hypothetical protein